MTGSFLVPIIVPIVALVAIAAWLGMVFWADAHPGRKAHTTAPASVVAVEVPPAAAEPGAAPAGELTPLAGDAKAA